MSNLMYLLLVMVLTGLGCLILWLRHRKPRSLESGIDAFHRELRALAPDQAQTRSRRPGAG